MAPGCSQRQRLHANYPGSFTAAPKDGAYLRTNMESLVLFGAPPEQYCPYDIASFDVEPTAFCYAFASNFQAIKYFRLDPSPLTGPEVLDNIKSYLAAGFPSMFGFPVY